MSTIFDNVMTDVTGKVRLESEDPRWIQLFSGSDVGSVSANFLQMRTYCDRLIENNPTTGNLLQLLEQTGSRLKQVSSRKARASSQSIDQCCIALRLSCLLMHCLVSKLPTSQLLIQLHLPARWPDVPGDAGPGDQHIPGDQQGSRSNFYYSRSTAGRKIVEDLLDAMVEAINTPSDRHAWMANIKFLCSDLLLCLCSTQLYRMPGEPLLEEQDSKGSGVGGASCAFNTAGDIFLNYLFIKGERQLRAALSQAHASSSAFSESLPVQMVRGLLLTTITAATTSAAARTARSSEVGAQTHRGDRGSGGPGASAATSGAINHAPTAEDFALMRALRKQFPPGRGGGAGAGSMAGEGGAAAPDRAQVLSALGALRSGGLGGSNLALSVQQLLLGFLMLIPISALQAYLRTQQPHASPVQAGLSESGEGGGTSAHLLPPKSGLAHDGDRAADAELAGWLPVPVMGALQLPSGDVCAERCASLLLVLLHNRRSPQQFRPNPFREAFCLLHDQAFDRGSGTDGGDEEAGGGGAGGPAASLGLDLLGSAHAEGRGSARDAGARVLMMATHIHIDFRHLMVGLACGLPGEAFSLLLYSLLQAHPTFIEAMISTGSVEMVMSKCLLGIYKLTGTRKGRGGESQRGDNTATAAASRPPFINQLYMLVVGVLIMVQDGALALELGKCKTHAPWYKQRQLTDVTLLDVTILCLLRAVMFATYRLHDAYLLTNACAVLHNLAPFSGGLAPYTAERLVRVAHQLCSRAVSKHQQQQQQQHLAGAAGVTSSSSCTSDESVDSTPRSSMLPLPAHVTQGAIGSAVPWNGSAAFDSFAASHDSLFEDSSERGLAVGLGGDDGSLASHASSAVTSSAASAGGCGEPVPQRGTGGSVSSALTTAQAQELHAQELRLLPEAITALLSFIYCAMRPSRLAQNVQLVYALIHDYDAVSTHLSHPAISYIITASEEDFCGEERGSSGEATAVGSMNASAAGVQGGLQDGSGSWGGGGSGIPARIVAQTEHYLRKIEGLLGEDHDRYLSAAQAVGALRAEIEAQLSITAAAGGAGGRFSSGRLHGSGAMQPTLKERERYSYQEADNPEEFFVPCVWTAALRTAPEIPWQVLEAALIDPIAAGFVTLQPPPLQQAADPWGLQGEQYAVISPEVDQV